MERLFFAILTENFPPCAGGGIAEWALGMATELTALGYEVQVLTRWRGTLPGDIYAHRLFGITRMRGHDWRLYRFWYTLFYGYRWLQTHPRGILIATTWELATSFKFLKRLFPRIRLVVVAHGTEITGLKTRPALRKCRAVVSQTTLTVAVSTFTCGALRCIVDAGARDKVVVIPNGVDIRRFYRVNDCRHIRERYGLASGDPVILTLARLVERKGHDTVIRCLPLLLPEFPGLKYLIAGPRKEPRYTQLRELARRLGLEQQVIFSDYVDPAEINAYYSSTAVYVMVSRLCESDGDAEGFGITYLEANACGCPVIGSNSGGIPDAIEDGVNGFLVPSDNEKALADKILLLLRDPAFASRMGERGRQRVEDRFTWKTIARQFIDQLTSRSGA